MYNYVYSRRFVFAKQICQLNWNSEVLFQSLGKQRYDIFSLSSSFGLQDWGDSQQEALYNLI